METASDLSLSPFSGLPGQIFLGVDPHAAQGDGDHTHDDPDLDDVHVLTITLVLSDQTGALQCYRLHPGLDHSAFFSHPSGEPSHPHCLRGIGGNCQPLLASVFYGMAIRLALVLLRTGQSLFTGLSLLVAGKLRGKSLSVDYNRRMVSTIGVEVKKEGLCFVAAVFIGICESAVVRCFPPDWDGCPD